MAGKRDEVFLLGEEEVGVDPPSAPQDEPSASAPEPGPSRSPRLRLRWPLILGALGLLAGLAVLVRSGGEEEPPQPRAGAPVVRKAPQSPTIVRVPRLPARPPRPSRRPRPAERNKLEPKAEKPAPIAEAASAPAPAPSYLPVPEAAPQAPAQPPPAPADPPPPPPRPEFGIER